MPESTPLVDLAPTETIPSCEESLHYCERLTRREAGNFYPAFCLLPRRQRRGMCALYAFLRLSDDLCDGPEPTEVKRQLLFDWRERYKRAQEGDCTHPIHPALGWMFREFRVPPRYLDDVLDGVAMDLDRARYPTFDDLYGYCYRVASAVGLACIHLWSFTDDRALKHAEQAGIAFQLTNILRDLGDDAARGRVYLPLDELARFGYSEDQLLRGETCDAFRSMMRFQVERARHYYDEGEALMELLDPSGRAVFRVLSRTYRALLDRMEQRDYDVFRERVRVSRWVKLAYLASAIPIRLGWR